MNLKRNLLSGPSRANLVFGPTSKSAWKRPKLASNVNHTDARHLFVEKLQWTTRGEDVAAMPECAHSSSAARPEPPHARLSKWRSTPVPSSSLSTPGSLSPSPYDHSRAEPPWPMGRARRRPHCRSSAPSCSQQAPPSASPPSHAHGARILCPNPLPKCRRAGTTAVAATCFHGQAAMDRLERGGWLSEFARHSWCFPTPPSPPTRPQPAGTGSSGKLLCFPRD